MKSITTPLGARVTVYPAPAHLGDGVLFHLSMVDQRDHRTAEVYLSPENVQELIDIIEPGGDPR